MKYYLDVLKKYAEFSGRARRKEYWMFILFHMLFAIVAMILDNLFGIAFGNIGYGPLYAIYSLVMFIPGLAVAVRRLHDVGKSGWMMLILLIPIIGAIWMLILLATEGNKGKNQHGTDPKWFGEEINEIGIPQE